MRTESVLYGLFWLLFLVSCKGKDNQTDIKPDTRTASDYQQAAVLWYEMSAEMCACYYQTYNLATEKVLLRAAAHKGEKKPAVVLDVDETVLNNSPFQAYCILKGIDYSWESWKAWTDKAVARPLPGALEFTLTAQNAGVEVFYITNRKSSEMEATIRNLKEAGFPYADSAHVFLRTAESGKENRRKRVAENYTILLLVGDNLNDLAEVFETRSEQFGITAVDSLRDRFGRDFIILPNPMYGAWESALYGDLKDLSPMQKDSLRRLLLLKISQ